MSEPEKRFKFGGCEAAIFENEIMKNGNVIKIKKATILSYDFDSQASTIVYRWSESFQLIIS